MAVNAAAMGRSTDNAIFKLRVTLTNTAAKSSYAKGDLRPGRATINKK
jgi:hypothetical protein